LGQRIDTIVDWWTSHSSAMVGVATGASSGLLVIHASSSLEFKHFLIAIPPFVVTPRSYRWLALQRQRNSAARHVLPLGASDTGWALVARDYPISY
jgi:hypothetical protein